MMQDAMKQEMWGCSKMVGMFKTAGAVLMLAGLAMGSPVQAANFGFETGDTTDWAIGAFDTVGLSDVTGSTDFTDKFGVVPPAIGNFGKPVLDGGYGVAEGSYAGFVSGVNADIEVTLTQIIHLNLGDTLQGKFGFRANDAFDSGVGLNDYAFVRIDGANILFTDVSTVGDFGDTGGWLPFSFVATADANYVLQFGTANTGPADPFSNPADPNYSSTAFLDELVVVSAPIPEPASWAMMMAGFFGLGAMVRGARRRAVAA
jgi:hypothetical protein